MIREGGVGAAFVDLRAVMTMVRVIGSCLRAIEERGQAAAACGLIAIVAFGAVTLIAGRLADDPTMKASHVVRSIDVG